MNFAANRGRAGELLALIDDALAAGADITLDTYPYLPGSTTLAALLPSWAHEGGPDATLALLDDARVARAHARGARGHRFRRRARRDRRLDGDPDLGGQDAALASAVGLTVAEWAELQGRDATTAALDLMRDDRLGTGILMHVGDEDNVRAIMRHPNHSAGSDGILVGGRPHPRAWGTFARYLGHYTRELGVLTPRGVRAPPRRTPGPPAGPRRSRRRARGRDRRPGALRPRDGARPRDVRRAAPARGRDRRRAGRGEFAVRDGVRTSVAGRVAS